MKLSEKIIEDNKNIFLGKLSLKSRIITKRNQMIL